MRTQIGAALLVVASFMSTSAFQRGSLARLATATNADAPLQFARAYFDDTQIAVALVNVSERTIEQATLGLVLSDDASQAAPAIRILSPCVASVPPGGGLAVPADHIAFDRVATFFQNQGKTYRAAAIGLTAARFADGTEWTYPLESKGRFEEKKDKAIQDRVSELAPKYFDDHDLSWAFPTAGLQTKFARCRK